MQPVQQFCQQQECYVKLGGHCVIHVLLMNTTNNVELVCYSPSCWSAGSRPAIGYTPASGQQFMTSNMSIPLFPGMPLGAMHLGPDGARPTMAGPAPAANGPTSAAGNRGGAASSAGPGAASGAGAGADANRAGQAIGLNLGTLLQSAFAGAGAGAGGQPNRPGWSLILTDSAFSGRPTARAHIAAVVFFAFCKAFAFVLCNELIILC